MSDLLLSKFYKFLTESIPTSVVKFGNEARKYETVETKIAGDHYISANMKTDSLLAYQELPESLLLDAGLSVDDAKKYSKSPFDIPKERHETVLKLAREWFISNYEEENNYYRMLNGLPNIDAEVEIWLTDDVYEEFGIEPCPIQDIPHIYLKAMEDMGMLEPIKKEYPTEKFLNYVGNSKIDIVTARRASDFEMLYFPNVTDSYSFYRNFLNIYEECRQYFMTVIYNKFFSTKYDYYDGYIGFMILTMTINRMIVSNFKVFVERDFYDEYSTQVFLSAYGVPYSSRFTLSQMKLIAKQLNILLRVKHTDIALLDVMDLLGFQNFTLSKYYLVKQHRMDDNGNPIFPKKKDPETGEEVLDKEAMYSYHFARVPVKAENVQEALSDVENHMSYQLITGMDPYWINDKELKDKLRDTKFNYIETKYMDITVIHKMHKILFETVYLTRIILDKREETQKVLVSMAKLSLNEIPIFDIMVFLISVVCKYYHVKPTLLKSPSKVLHIAGFNYNADIDAIRKDIKDRPYIYDQELLKYIDNVAFTKPDDINNFYVQIKNLNVKLTKLMTTASTLEAYRAYRKLYDTLMYIELNEEVYKLPNGTIPETFPEYLEVANPPLYEAYESLQEDEDVSNMIGYVTARLMNILTDTRYLSHIQVMDTSIAEALLKLLSYFKSLTVDFRDVNVVLLFDSRILNGAHVYNSLKMNNLHMEIDEWALKSPFWEYVKKFSGQIELESERATDDDIMKAIENFLLYQDIYTKDGIIGEEATLDISDKPTITMDILESSSAMMNALMGKVSIEDKYRTFSTLTNLDYLQTLWKITKVESTNSIKETILSDVNKLILTAIQECGDKLTVKEVVKLIVTFSRLLKFKVDERLVEGAMTGNINQSISIDVDSNEFISKLLKKEYAEVTEKYINHLVNVVLVDNVGEFVKECKDTADMIIDSMKVELDKLQLREKYVILEADKIPTKNI